MPLYEVLIVGGGPSGLSAALVLGRCRRSVLICDEGEPRNKASRAIHGFLTRDGTPPAEFRQAAHEQMVRYANVEFRALKVQSITREGEHFEATLSDGTSVQSRTILLATGVKDQLPEVTGIQLFYGQGVFHCPYCDGWEHQDMPLAAYGNGEAAFDLACELLRWSGDVTLCCKDPLELTPEQRTKLDILKVRVISSALTAVGAHGGPKLELLRFADGSEQPCRALFFVTEVCEPSPLIEATGCPVKVDGSVETSDPKIDEASGVYVAGNVRCGLHLVIVASGQGTEAAFHINEDLQQAELDSRWGEAGAFAKSSQ